MPTPIRAAPPGLPLDPSFSFAACFDVTQIVLVRSTLGRAGTRHETVLRHELDALDPAAPAPEPCPADEASAGEANH